ncbi:hypothetical protein Mpe_A0390 [Methylibium petroleiphilum PM1]|uniref:Uncharacterized protein n=1 Tax=Methylibium petroleiphilum (strain ATCC BAA-1232 / LMG 22953 / PM1) TaxID=420662 RepID=A2SCR3_METPP|nr:hypothetical protein Mpe_A0390 [Methylibium petroleiphilum PM1]
MGHAARGIVVPVEPQAARLRAHRLQHHEVTGIVGENRQPRRAPRRHDIGAGIGKVGQFAPDLASRQQAAIVLRAERRVPGLAVVPGEQCLKVGRKPGALWQQGGQRGQVFCARRRPQGGAHLRRESGVEPGEHGRKCRGVFGAGGRHGDGLQPTTARR